MIYILSRQRQGYLKLLKTEKPLYEVKYGYFQTILHNLKVLPTSSISKLLLVLHQEFQSRCYTCLQLKGSKFEVRKISKIICTQVLIFQVQAYIYFKDYATQLSVITFYSLSFFLCITLKKICLSEPRISLLECLKPQQGAA